jgi:hypothetical protein
MIEGKYNEVGDTTEIDELSDISIHSHPTDISKSPTLPSFNDLLLINPKGENFIFDADGLIFFSEIKKHPRTELPWRPLLYLGVEQLKESFRFLVSVEKHKPEFNIDKFAETFLEKMGVNIIRKPWKMLSNNPFSGFKI